MQKLSQLYWVGPLGISLWILFSVNGVVRIHQEHAKSILHVCLSFYGRRRTKNFGLYGRRASNFAQSKMGVPHHSGKLHIEKCFAHNLHHFSIMVLFHCAENWSRFSILRSQPQLEFFENYIFKESDDGKSSIRDVIKSFSHQYRMWRSFTTQVTPFTFTRRKMCTNNF